MPITIEGDISKSHAERMLVCCHNMAPIHTGVVQCCGKPAVAWRYTHDVTRQLCSISPTCEDHPPPKVLSARKRKMWGVIDLVPNWR